MDFFSSQDAARRKTNLLILYFFLALFFIIGTIYLAVMLLFVLQQSKTGQLSAGQLWNTDLFFAVVGATIMVVFCGSLYKISMLRSGGVRVAEMLGGRLIPAGSQDFFEKRLLNIVEEMAIASGIAVPPVYLMDKEKGINAFAAGFTPEDAVIGITRGALETLSREELQGVVGHEFSHILNGDMRLDLKLVGFLHGILLIALIGRSILHGSRRGRTSKNSGGAVLFGLILLVIGYIGVLFGKLIKSGVSRQREYLADASAVQFTRNPQGLAGALKKIGGLAAGSIIEHNSAEEISHMFFSNGLEASWLGALSTHPPLAERITRLDPGFDGTFPTLIRKQVDPARAAGSVKIAREPQEKIKQGAAVIALAVLAGNPKNITRNIGTPVRKHMESARKTIESLPARLYEATKDPFGARAVIYGLLLDDDYEVQARQLEVLKFSADRQVLKATEEILSLMQPLPDEARLPLMDLAMPSLRSLSLAQFRAFEKNISSLVRADKRVSLFELTLEHVIVKRLEKNFVTQQHSVKAIKSVRDAAEEISCTLSLLANIGHTGEEAFAAFAAGAAIFKDEDAALQYLGREECRDIKPDIVLDRLARLSPKIKKSVITACFQSLVHDSQITIKEAEFFRLLVYALDTPLPPWINI